MRWSYGSWRLYCTVYSLIFLFSNNIYSYSRYELNCDRSLLNESRKILLMQIGNTETAGNGGIAQIYLNSVGLSGNHPYCAAGQYYCFYKACLNLKISEKKIPIPRTGLSRNIFNFSVKNGFKSNPSPKIDDLIIWRMIGSNWKGHTERIIATYNAGWVKTVAFNVALDKDKEGVAVKRRNIFHPVGKLMVLGIVGFRDV